METKNNNYKLKRRSSIWSNKKAEDLLTPETLKIIVAVLCIIILLYLAYQLVPKKTALAQARENLNKINFEIQKVISGEKNQSDFFIESPNDWWVIAWPYKGDTDKPAQCKNPDCICLCPIPTIPSKGYSLKECDNIGVCKDLDKPVKTMYKAEPVGAYATTVKSVESFLGYDVENVPLDIGGALPIRIVMENGVVIVEKDRNNNEAKK